jgi:hypothetical protein
MSTLAPQASATDDGTTITDPIVQYVVLRRDLWREHQWPLGSVVAQGCHASVAAIWLNRDDPLTQAYMADGALDSMRKVRVVATNAFCIPDKHSQA